MAARRYHYQFIGFLCLVAALLQLAGTLEVAIIGAGIGGSSCAYYLNQMRPNVSLTVLDSNSYIGGRIRHTQFLGRTVELGADAWATSNRYIVELARAVNITLSEKRAAREPSGIDWEDLLNEGQDNGCGCQARDCGAGRTAATGDSLNIWDGSNLTNPVTLAESNLTSTAIVFFQLSKFLLKLEANYLERDELGRTFSSISDFIQYGSLSEYTKMSTAQFYTGHGVSDEMERYIIEPTLKAIYGQTSGITNAFASLVSLTSAAEPASSVEGGNSKLPEALLKASGAKVMLNSTVASVAKPGSIHRYSIDYRGPAGTSQTLEADVVVVAAPLEHTGVKFINMTFERDEPIRAWVQVYVTYVVAKRLEPTYFGRDESWQEPEVILTTAEQTQMPFDSLQHYDDVDGLRIYRLFSPANLTLFLPDLFQGISEQQEFLWPYTFPHLLPVLKETGYQTVELAEDLYNVNAMESVVSAMEGSVIGARNIAMLIDQSWTATRLK